MRVTLNDGATTGSIDFDPTNLKWTKQSGTATHIVGYSTGLPRPFNSLFIKYWQPGPASGHGLLVGSIGRPIVGTPALFAHAEDTNGHLYFIENLPPTFKTLDEILLGYQKQIRASDAIPAGLEGLFSQEFVNMAVEQLAATYEKIWERGYLFVDFCHKNISFDGSKQLSLIDIDSSYPIVNINPDDWRGQKWSIEFWYLWLRYLVRSPPSIDERLCKTIVLSFGAIWARAFALSRNQTTISDALNLVYGTLVGEQNQIWNALDQRVETTFLKCFGLQSSAGEQYRIWLNIFLVFSSGGEVSWGMVREAISGLLAAISATPKGKLTTATATITRSMPLPPPSLTPPTSIPPAPRPVARQVPVSPQPPTPPPAPRPIVHAAPVQPTPTAVILPQPIPPTPSGRRALWFIGSLIVAALAIWFVYRSASVHTAILQQNATANAPSFDCSKAIGWATQQVCASPELAALDRQLASLYSDTLRPLSRHQRIKVRNNQRRWIKNRDACVSASNALQCLHNIYGSRIAALTEGIQRRTVAVATKAQTEMTRPQQQTFLRNPITTGGTTANLGGQPQGAPTEPSLADNLNFIRDKIAEQGMINVTSLLHDSANNSDLTNQFYFEYSNVRVDASLCRVDYHFYTGNNVRGSGGHDAEISVILKDVKSVRVAPWAQALSETAAAGGHPTWTIQLDPPITAVIVHRMTENDDFGFRDEDTANRVANAILRAVGQCGGGN